ncbi:MAG: hypothetical protein K8W52_31450 [Deltaproteobacteria bacterium]|nr:hypothetical protein [Deltaproteobacteria bacterium]
MRHVYLIALTLVAGCFNPTFKADLACGPAGECPPGQTCGADGHCHAPLDAATIDGASIDAIVVDAAVDATPVACSSDPECATPPNPCFKPGTCDLGAHVCVFPAVDCVGLGDSCNAGACDMATGNCIKVPINENQACGAQSCTDFDACGGFAETCDSTGTQSRTCTTPTCQAGACNPVDAVETQDCSRITEDTTCQPSTVTGCGACGMATNSGCGPGTQSCVCTDYTCKSDTCTPTANACAQTCTELSEGDVCASVLCGANGETFRDKCCSAAGLCSVFCSTCQ